MTDAQHNRSNDVKKYIEEAIESIISVLYTAGIRSDIVLEKNSGGVGQSIYKMTKTVLANNARSTLNNYFHDIHSIKDCNKIKLELISNVTIQKQRVLNSKTGCATIIINGTQIAKINTIVEAVLNNNKPILIKFGVNDDDRIYTKEEIKVLIKQAECNYSTKQTNTTANSGRADRYTFLSLLVDISTTLTQKNPIRLVDTDIDSKQDEKDLKNDKITKTQFNERRQRKLGKAFDNIRQVANEAKQDPDSPNILLIPYSADGHVVTLLVDKNKFCSDKEVDRKNSIMCFDSSHYFTFNSEHWYTIPGSFLRLGVKYILDHNTPRRSLLALVGGVGTLWLTSNPFISTTTLASLVCTDVAINNSDIMDKPLLNGNFINKYFYNALYNCMIKKPINDKMIQGLKGTCSFYTEAFCYLVSKYIQDKKNEGMDLNLNDISNHINSKEFIKQLKDKKEEFFNEYKATMKEVEQKQEQQSISKTQDVTANKEISQQVSNTSTPTVTEESPSNSQFPSHSTTPSKTNSTQSISSSSPTTEHLQTLQQQVSVQSQNSQSPQTQSEPPTLVEGMRNIVGSTLTSSGATSMEGSHTPTTSQMSGTSSLSKSPGPSTQN